MASPDDAGSLLDRITRIRRYTEGEFIAPNKPVTLLWALARLEEGEPRLVPFSQFEEELRPLLTAAGRPNTLPVHAFWALQTDGLWEVVAEGELTGRTGSREPTTASLRELASGGLSEEVFDALRQNVSLREAVSALLREQLREGTPSTIHVPPAGSARETVERLIRDPAFRRGTLNAYGACCVVCGWGVCSEGKPVAVAAAHVHPLEAQGPDAPGNGIALCVHHHALFDAGLFSYDEERRVMVSIAWEGENRGAMPSLEDHAGMSLPKALDPAGEVRDEYLAWHRENVFLG
jgi:putative restriction endonuclease